MRPSEAKIHHNMGINLKRAGKLQDALACYKNAMDLEPDNSVFLYNTGLLYNIQSSHDDAIDVLEKSIKKNSENVYAYLALGDAYEKNQNPKKALAVYKELASLGVNVHGLTEKLQFLEKKLQEDQDAVKKAARAAQEAEDDKIRS
jgi:tetratricopeptide (TPR) repeat protein